MKKAILIGSLLAVACGSLQSIKGATQPPFFAATSAVVRTESDRFSTETPRLAEPQQPSDSSTNSYGIWWILLGVALLTLPLYTLFLLRKRQQLAIDIERLRADRSLLYDSAPCGYHAVNDRGMVVNMNETLLRWLGYRRDDVVGKLNFADVVAGERWEAEQQITALLQERPTGKVDMDFLTKEGKRRPMILTELPYEGSAKKRATRLFATLDNSACREALERIRTLDQELESFSYSISHDLRAPLRSIDGYSRILQEDYAPQLGDEGKRVLMIIMNNAKRMGMLIDDLLEFGRLGRKVLQPSHINMTSMAGLVVHEVMSRYSDRTIDIRVDELGHAVGDADMMRQVWFNLVDNACKYTAKKNPAMIEVRSFRTERGEIGYAVKDNGVGFDMKYASKLFGVFQRLHKIQDFAGTGVGLAIVKRIINRHGGRVWAEASPDKGASFYFTIPIDDENN